MKNPTLNPEHFLNRLPLKYNCNATAVPIPLVLRELFEPLPLQGHQQSFNDYCNAALTDAYSWAGGSPANAVYYGACLELLIEVGWLLHRHAPKQKDRKRPALHRLPVPLTAQEYRRPQLFLQQFFAYAALRKWKLLVAAFTLNAVGNSSVADEVAAPELLVFYTYIQKLIYAVHRVALLKGLKPA